MCEYKVKLIGFIFVLIVLFVSTTVGQETQQSSQGELQEFLDQYRSAFKEENTQKTAQLVRKNGEHARIVAEVLFNEGIKAYQTVNYETALDRFLLSYELYQQLENKEESAIILLGLSSIYMATEAYQQALDNLQEALTIFKTTSNRVGEGVVLSNLGAIYRMTGEHQHALGYFQEALAIFKSIGNREGEGNILGNLGVTYDATGELQQALRYYQEALTIYREIGDRASEGSILNKIGLIYGEFQQTLRYYQEALTIHREIGDRASEGPILNSIGLAYRATGEYQRALGYFQEALTIHREIGDLTGEGITLNNIGTIYHATGAYQRALGYFQEALTIHREIGDLRGEGTILNNIGGLYEVTEAYQQALEYYQEALSIHREIGDLTGEGITLNNIGTIYHATGAYSQALQYHQEALTISREIGDLTGEGVALNNIGTIYHATGAYQRALSYFQEALSIQREIGDRAGEGNALKNIGVIYDATGEDPQALGYLQDALSIFEEIGDRAGEGNVLNNIGIIYEAKGELQQALGFYQEALSIFEEIDDLSGKGITLNNIGTIYEVIGAYQQALNYFQDARSIFEEIGALAEEERALDCIGRIYYVTGAYQLALASYQKALTIQREIGDRVAEGMTLNDIVQIYLLIGEYQQGLDYLQRALTIHREIGYLRGEGTTLNNIGVIYNVIGEYQQALGFCQEALSIFETIGDRVIKGMIILPNIGYVYEQYEQWREAVGYYQQAIALLETIRSKAGESEAKESLLGQQISVYSHTVKLLLQLSAPEEAFVYTERSKARSFLEVLYEASTGMKHGVDQQLLAEETNLYGKLSDIEQNLKEQISDEQRKQLLEKRHSLEHELSVLQMELRTSNPRYAELKYPQPVTVEQVQQEILKEGEVIVEYLQGDEELYVFIIGKRSFSTYTIELKAQDLSDRIEQFLKPLRSASHEKLNAELATQLYQLLFQPLEQKIVDANSGKNIQHLIIIPDGVLFYLPFEMLATKDGETPEYLVDRYTISYAPSASVLKPEILPTRQSEHYAQDLLALAPFGEEGTETTKVALRSTENLLLSDTLRFGLEDVQPLPYSAGEVQTISSLYPQSVCKIGADATKAFFKDYAKGNRFLHLSTHGYLDNEHAMYSGLLFSDGMLQTYEIFNLDIDAELTVLSACETGLGELKAGEGLVGLTRAFMYAGSPSVLVSLWPVSDPSTAAFMKRFYRNLNRGMTKAEALRETKLWMKAKSYHTDEHGNVIKHDNPFYWAPFILVGAHE